MALVRRVEREDSAEEGARGVEVVTEETEALIEAEGAFNDCTRNVLHSRGDKKARRQARDKAPS
jgi:hypothetical protein